MTTALTAKSLLEIDSTFKALLSLWWTEKDIPLVLVDRLLEFDLVKQADCVRWMLRRNKLPSGDDVREYRPPTPVYFALPEFQDWGWLLCEGRIRNATELPIRLFWHNNQPPAYHYLTTKRGPEEAICAALDAYIGDRQ